jgi:two-component system, OmpR family, sensor histidine kinase KdpD
MSRGTLRSYLGAAPGVGGLPRRRRQAAWALALAAPPLQAAAMVPFRPELHLSTVILLFLLPAVGAAAVGGAWPALAAATLGFFLANWFFTPPLHTWTIAQRGGTTMVVVLPTSPGPELATDPQLLPA